MMNFIARNISGFGWFGRQSCLCDNCQQSGSTGSVTHQCDLYIVVIRFKWNFLNLIQKADNNFVGVHGIIHNRKG